MSTATLTPPPAAGTGWQAVTRDKFFAHIKPLDVHPSPQGKYPYTSIWRSRAGQARGKTVDFFENGTAGNVKTLYCLPK